MLQSGTFSQAGLEADLPTGVSCGESFIGVRIFGGVMLLLTVRGGGGVFCGGVCCFGRVWGWRLGDGRSIGVFKHQWIPKASNPYVESRSSVDMLDFRVADLIDEVTLEWRKPLIGVLFPREIVPEHSCYSYS